MSQISMSDYSSVNQRGTFVHATHKNSTVKLTLSCFLDFWPRSKSCGNNLTWMS